MKIDQTHGDVPKNYQKCNWIIKNKLTRKCVILWFCKLRIAIYTQKVSAQIIIYFFLSKDPITSKYRLYTSKMSLCKVPKPALPITLGQNYIRCHKTLTGNHFNSTDKSINLDPIVGS